MSQQFTVEHGIPIPVFRVPRPEGCCKKCHRIPKPGYKHCNTCLAEVSAAYRKQRAKGLCGYGGCKEQSEQGHSMCRPHLEYSSGNIQRLLKGRVAAGLCRRCGTRPRIFGDATFCVFCRMDHRTPDGSPIPLKMRRIIRQFWRLDRIDKRRTFAESAVQQIETPRLREVISLRHGLIDGIDHTLEEVGQMLGVTRERIRQLEKKALTRLENKGIDVSALRYPLKDLQRPINKTRQHKMTERDVKKQKAHHLVKLAIDSGEIIRQPCHECERVDAIAHHPDYDKPLEVVWLCRPHHAKAHGRGLGTKRTQKYPAPTGPREGWWLKRVIPKNSHYDAASIVAALKRHGIKQKAVKIATGLSTVTLNAVVRGSEVKDEQLLAVLRFVETLNSANSGTSSP